MTRDSMGPAQRHADDAALITALAESASDEDWGRPSPVAEWTALDVVRHLVEWPGEFLEGAGIRLAELDVGADPVGAWRQHVARIQDILENPEGRVLSNPEIGDRPVDEAIDEFYTTDVWMHSWDLAKALGREPDLGAERCATVLAAMGPIEQILRESGEYGPEVPVSPQASEQDRLLAFIGRDPAWQPPN
ncbi:maleylpyruvate isomerase family mycothiol-dependent enzyme [Nocardiopsis metallicus]|uniref:Uncharacterized protein (TIGR03086 family) n=1 Tax=Nocardiopsis metallicus TaxID=179819 RepID=A0A840W2Q3_9ACTN|nr:maleylpyruvate isomerase family mycothiol-dependent enzyme [Nocardiopsis metallicus]MBB5490342.1 uncharacterized protein (TIGR03086 family) [Nocardiopsis metallicus]